MKKQEPEKKRKSFKFPSIKDIFYDRRPSQEDEESLKEFLPTARSSFSADRRVTFSDNISNISIRTEDIEFEKNLRELIAQSEEKKENLSLLIKNESNDYQYDGFIISSQDIKRDEIEYEISDEELTETNKPYSYYEKHFYGKEHFNFIGRYRNSQNEIIIFILSVKFLIDKIQCIFRTKDGNRYEEIEFKELFTDPNEEINVEKIDILQIINKLTENLPIDDIKIVINPMVSQYLIKYDKDLIKQTFTFGIIYQKYGQVNEKEIFGNTENSEDFDEFLDFIGQRINLKNFTGFRGMLDIVNDDTGKESIYEKHDESEIMFHVSTLLPASEKDLQHIERKRHIGNDRVSIVFQDRETPFSPRMIKSKLLHVFLIVQPVKIDGVTKRYKISVISKKDVPYFEPIIRPPYIFNKDDNLKKFILLKLINAEYASLRAPAFSVFTEQTIIPVISKLCGQLKTLTLKFALLGQNLDELIGKAKNKSESESENKPLKQSKFSFRRTSEARNDSLVLKEDDNSPSKQKKSFKGRFRKNAKNNLDLSEISSENKSLTPSINASEENMSEKKNNASLSESEDNKSESHEIAEKTNPIEDVEEPENIKYSSNNSLSSKTSEKNGSNESIGLNYNVR